MPYIVSFNSNTMGTISGARIVYPFWLSEFIPSVWCFVDNCFSFLL